MEIERILSSAKEFDKDGTWKKKIEDASQGHEKFLSLYPFRKQPERINLVTPERLYNPGTDDYFFLWIEHRLKNLGHIRIGSALIWGNARDNIERFKELLRKATDDSIPLFEKIDANWQDIKFFGGDKNVAKKIIWCYYPHDFLPIFKTDDLEHFARNLVLDYTK